MSQPICPTCQATDSACLGRLPDSNWFAGIDLGRPLSGGYLFRCASCRLKFRFPVLSSEEYLRLYDNVITGTWAADGERPDWQRIVDVVERRVPLGGRVLDFGCYTGGLLSRLTGRFDCHGIEVNRKAAAVARATTGATVWDSAAQLPTSLCFDAVIAADVIEHVRDPRSLIEQLLPLVKVGGVLIISTGDAEYPIWRRFGANWWYCSYPEHIAFISQAWLEGLCKTMAIVILECAAFAYRPLSSSSRVLEAIAMVFYGFFPQTFLALKRCAHRIRGRRSLVRVPGNGVGADHLLIVLARSHSLD